MKRRYPLEALRELRQRAVETKARELATSLDRTQVAERRAEAAVRARTEHQRATRAAAEDESVRIEAGDARAADLQNAALWAEQRRRELEVLDERRARAAEELAAKRRAEQAARESLAQADGQAQVVDKHRATWQRDETSREERREEDEALELVVARSRKEGER